MFRKRTSLWVQNEKVKKNRFPVSIQRSIQNQKISLTRNEIEEEQNYVSFSQKKEMNGKQTERYFTKWLKLLKLGKSCSTLK